MSVRVLEGWAGGRMVPEARLELRPIIGAEDRWNVLLDGEKIGNVWKGSRRWSPPTHRGSRIARFHRQVPEWHAARASTYSPEWRKDTRVEALRELLATRP